MKGKQWVPRAVRKIRVACPEVYFAPLSPGSQECFSEILTWGRERRQRRVIVRSCWLNFLTVFFTRFDQIGMWFLSSRGWGSLGVPGPGLAHKGY